MKEKLRKRRKLIDICVIILVASILGAPLLMHNVDVYCDDGIQHIARAFGTLLSFKEDGLFSNVISSFTNNFGYSWNLFYGPISTYAVIIISLVINNFAVGYKIVCYLAMILSGIFMYKFVFALINNRNASLLASILYMTFPYHLTELYTRNALRRIYVIYIYTNSIFRIV